MGVEPTFSDTSTRLVFAIGFAACPKNAGFEGKPSSSASLLRSLLPALRAELTEARMRDRMFLVVVRLVHVHALACRGVEHFGLIDVLGFATNDAIT